MPDAHTEKRRPSALLPNHARAHFTRVCAVDACLHAGSGPHKKASRMSNCIFIGQVGKDGRWFCREVAEKE
eukprot:scaffold171292_cov14-Tisochrysis_lutea.AAC.1